MDKQTAVIFLTGYLKGWLIRHGGKIDPAAVECLRILGGKEVHLAVFDNDLEDTMPEEYFCSPSQPKPGGE